MSAKMGSNIETLLECAPYTLTKNEKSVIFLNSMKEAIKFHYEKSKEFRKLCDNRGFVQTKNFSVEEIPFLPVSLFKKFKLKSVPDSEIFKTVYSSSTTSNLPSIIFLDRITSERQTKVLISIMRNFLTEKKNFLIIDQDNSMNTLHDIKSRSSAIRGFFPFMKSVKFVLDNDLKLDEEQCQELNKKNVCVFGFTWLLYKIISENKDNIKIKNIFKTLENIIIIHMGGWKKLQDLQISKEQFNQMASEFFNCKKENIIDVYGMTEQLGTIYPDCDAGYKHVPTYSEVMIRNTDTLEIEEIGKSGFIQLLSPIPHSYPGISLLSDDIGKIMGIDNCPCGRKGKYFQFEKRAEQADIKGCGDTIS